jgi:hypothetical protein
VIERKSSTSSNYTLIGSVPVSNSYSYQDKTASAGNVYTYRVRAYIQRTSTNVAYGSYSNVLGVWLQSGSVNFTLQPLENFRVVITRTNSISGATGYEISKSRQSASGFQILTTLNASTSSYTDPNTQHIKTLYYKITPFKTVGGVKYYGQASSVKKVTTISINAPTITVKSSKAKQVVVQWSSSSYAAGYKVYRSTSKDGTYKLIKTINNSSTRSYTDKSVTSKKTYYYKVRAVDRFGNNSPYSAVKSVKVK